MFGKVRGIDIGKIGSLGFAIARLQVIAKGALRPMLTKEPCRKIFKIAQRHPARPGIVARLGILAPDIDKDLRLTALGDALHSDGRADKHQNKVHAKRPDNPVSQMIFDPHTQKGLRVQNANAKRPVSQERGWQQPALHKGRHQKRIGPKHKARSQAKPHPGPVDVFKVDRGQNRRAELRHGGKGQHPDIRQRIVFREEPIETISQKQDGNDGGPADFQQHLTDIARHAFLEPFRTQQKRHDQIVTDHGRNRDTGHNHHPGTGRQTTDKGKYRQPVLPTEQRQGQNKGIGINRRVMAKHEQTGNRDRHDKDIDRNQIGRKQPARAGQVAAVIIFNKGHMELARQTENGKPRQHGGDKEV